MASARKVSLEADFREEAEVEEEKEEEETEAETEASRRQRWRRKQRRRRRGRHVVASGAPPISYRSRFYSFYFFLFDILAFSIVE